MSFNRGDRVTEKLTGFEGVILDVLNKGDRDKRFHCKFWNDVIRDYIYTQVYPFEVEPSAGKKRARRVKGFSKDL